MQRRGLETLERLAAATEALLRHRPFERITVQDIVARAGRPIGSFYARFGSKEAMLPFLYERYDRSLEPEFEALLRDVDWAQLDLASTIAALVDVLVGVYEKKHWLLRALALFARQHPEVLSIELLDRRKRLYDRIAQILLRHRNLLAHDDPEAAVRFGLFIVSSVARERLLFSQAPLARVTAMPAARLRVELTRLLHAYLAAREPPT